MNKNFNGQTIVLKDRGMIGSFLTIQKNGNWIKPEFFAFEKVKLEDPVFEKIFNVYSTDQIEARYLLTTAFMERLITLTEIFKNNPIECSFYDDHLLITIQCKNLFTPGPINKSEDFIDDSKILLKSINTIFEIIDILKLDQNIGM